MAAKTFKIGEWARGGIIAVEVHGRDVWLFNREWDSNELLEDVRSTHLEEIRATLYDWTSVYYADKIMDWITDQLVTAEAPHGSI